MTIKVHKKNNVELRIEGEEYQSLLDKYNDGEPAVFYTKSHVGMKEYMRLGLMAKNNTEEFTDELMLKYLYQDVEGTPYFESVDEAEDVDGAFMAIILEKVTEQILGN